MRVEFKKKYLEKCFRNKSEAVKKWGTEVGTKYRKQLLLVYAANSGDDLFHIPQLHFHPLTGDRKGQYSIRLTGRARLIAEINDNTLFIVQEVNTEHYE